jgi:hypothetical protein
MKYYILLHNSQLTKKLYLVMASFQPLVCNLLTLGAFDVTEKKSTLVSFRLVYVLVFWLHSQKLQGKLERVRMSTKIRARKIRFCSTYYSTTGVGNSFVFAGHIRDKYGITSRYMSM